MPEGSLTQSIETLRGALGAATALLGGPPTDDSPGSGLAGAAGVAATSPSDRVDAFAVQFGQQVSGVLRLDPATALAGVVDVFASLKTEAQAPPGEPLRAFAERLTQANAVFGGDFVQRIQAALDAVRGISEGIPADRTAIVSALLDQILGVLASLEGPEAEKIRSWVQSTQELHRVLMPLIAEAESAPDPAAIAVQVIQRSLDSTLEVFGFDGIRSLVAFLDEFPSTAVAPDALAGVSAALGSTSTSYAQVLPVVNAGYVEFRDTVVAAAAAVQALKIQLRPVMSGIRRVATAKILQPGGLEQFLREQMERALAVEVQEVQRIDDPFAALFDRIDAAIGGIDLSSVRTEVLGFFENTRSTIERVDIGSVGTTLQQQLAAVEQAVQDLQQGVTELLSQLEAQFDELSERGRALAGQVGEFQPDGTFRFDFEQELRQTLTSARFAIGGDPNDPAAPSVAGSLNQFQAAIDQILRQLNDLLTPVEDGIASATTAAVGGIQDFSAFLEGLDLPALMEQLRQKVDEILDALTPIDFDGVVDPVVAGIEENTEKLRNIDPDSLNDLLREALRVALDVIIQIDFTATISAPLREQFAAVKAVPAQAIEQLQQRYEQAIAVLDELEPENLLAALFSAFDTINQAVGSLNVAALLQPLDQLHEQHLQQPIGRLKPSTLLQPVADAFQDFTSAFDDISGAAIIAPVNAQLNDLKATVTGFDITSWVDDLLAAVERVKQDLRDIRPSELLQPLVADFARLEAEVDRVRPSVLFQPAAELATPLLQALENIQQGAIEALFQAFQAPLALLDRLEPEAFVRNIQQQIDGALAALNTLNLPARYNQLKGQYFDLRLAVTAQGDEARLALVGFLDPERQLAELIRTYNDLVGALGGLRRNLQLANLAELYGELRERLLGMLPPYARELLDPETFKRVMRLADPTRFLQELDQRFEALRNRLIPIRPEDIAAELDATYAAVLALVDELEIGESLNQVKELFSGIKDIVNSIRVDFLAADIDAAIAGFRTMVEALDPARLFADLDAIHHEVELVVASTVPSQVVAGLQDPLDRVQRIVASVDPRTTLGPPLGEAWESVQNALEQVDFTVVLSPLVDKLDELKQSFESGLRRTEDAFDEMLGTARGALSGSAAVGAGVTI